MSDEKGMTQADWTAELLKDAEFISLPTHDLVKRRGRWVAQRLDGSIVFNRGFKHPADAYQKLMEIIGG